MDGATVNNCPHCGIRAVRILESRKEGGFIRRRKKCSACDERFTTFELTQSQLDELRYLSGVAKKLFKFIEEHESKTFSAASKNCDYCIHMSALGECSMGFPEAGGSFADECSLYRESI
jgi:hypothetical protein